MKLGPMIAVTFHSLVLVLQCAGADIPSAREILDRAIQQQLEVRNISFSFHSKNTILRDDQTHTEGTIATFSGEHVFFDGQHRSSRHYKQFGPSGNLEASYEALETFDGNLAKLLRTREGISKGFVDPSPLGHSPETGAWLFTGELYGVSEARESIERSSVLDQIQKQLASGKVEVTKNRDYRGREVYVLTSAMPWGSCTVQIDPHRGYSMVGLSSVISPVPLYNAKSVAYDTDYVELQEIDGTWLPKAARFRTRHEYEGERIVEIEHEIVLDELKRMTERPPSTYFSIDWPKDVLIKDRVLGIEYGREMEHPFDQMFTDIERDKEWSELEQHKIRVPERDSRVQVLPQHTLAGETTGELKFSDWAAWLVAGAVAMAITVLIVLQTRRATEN